MQIEMKHRAGKMERSNQAEVTKAETMWNAVFYWVNN